MEQKVRDAVTRIFSELASRDLGDIRQQKLLLDEVGDDCRQYFGKHESCLEPKARVEHQVKLPFVEQRVRTDYTRTFIRCRCSVDADEQAAMKIRHACGRCRTVSSGRRWIAGRTTNNAVGSPSVMKIDRARRSVCREGMPRVTTRGWCRAVTCCVGLGSRLGRVQPRFCLLDGLRIVNVFAGRVVSGVLDLNELCTNFRSRKTLSRERKCRNHRKCQHDGSNGEFHGLDLQ